MDATAATKERIAQAIEAERSAILDLSHRIHEWPELAFEERMASRWIGELLEEQGFTVQRPAGRLETAISARMVGGRGSEGPRIAILGEYDALPNLGHGCGHNIMAASAVGAAIGLAAVAEEFQGEVLILGTPAEENGSGKQYMIDDGLFDGLDAALLFHPSDRTQLECALLALEDVTVEFAGRAAHAAAAPWEGKNALDPLVLLLTSVGLWRQQLRPDARVHGIVVEGGAAANIIPARSRASFTIRSADDAYLEVMHERFEDLVAAAALATGCGSSLSFSGRSRTMCDNATLREVFSANLPEADQLPSSNAGAPTLSSDIGNVSWVVPAIHPSIAVCDEGTPLHSAAFREAAGSPFADEAAVAVATALAQTAYDLIDRPELLERAWREHRRAQVPPP